jgi:hypothetical protein
VTNNVELSGTKMEGTHREMNRNTEHLLIGW